MYSKGFSYKSRCSSSHSAEKLCRVEFVLALGTAAVAYGTQRACVQRHPIVPSQIEVKFPEGGLEKVPEDTFLLAILDEDWPEYLQERRCSVRDKLNRWKIELSPERTMSSEAKFYTTIRQVK